MALDPQLLEILACPQDKGPLLYFADEDEVFAKTIKAYVKRVAIAKTAKSGKR